MVKIKRKVIQIANSTQLVSLPRKWVLKYNIKKGDEINVEEESNRIVLSTQSIKHHEVAVIDAEKWGIALPRVIYSLYKKGVDEIRINFSTPAGLETVQKSLGKETVGFELMDQGRDYCIIKNVAGDLEDFDAVLRRTLLILMQMAQESHDAIKNENYKHLKNVAFLEESNNRFTTTCRRLLNKKGHPVYSYIGPLYYIIEELENIADQYKYLCSYLTKLNPGKSRPSKEVMEVYEIVNHSLKLFYEVFYKFDEKKIVEIVEKRKFVVEKVNELFDKKTSVVDLRILHHQVIIMQKVFCLIGPYMILSL